MAGWLCPRCRRRFGRVNQSHGCAPAMSADVYFERRPATDRKICDAVVRYLESLGDITVDYVSVGVLIKRARTFAELRPRRKGMMLSFLLSRVVDHDRIARRIALSANRTAHFVELAGPREVDRVVKSWLAEAYVASTT